MNKNAAVLVIGLFVSSHGIAQGVMPSIGNYITEGGWGNLSIQQKKPEGIVFEIHSFGANAHSCQLEGEIRNGRATLESSDKEKPCLIDFQPSSRGVNVVPQTLQECREYCGMRAGFDGLYLKPVRGCENIDRQATKDKFKHLYDGKNYRDARLTIETLLNSCSTTLGQYELGAIRNDLAITQYHLGDFSGCLNTLEPYAKDAAIAANDAVKDYPPADAEAYSGILDAARTNIKLCHRKLHK
ncbi:MAG: hypothetical protein WBD81_03330 [Collimonas pratensis]|uniref:hypothetical protein n=1 Tax=Collimonas pratensis TaxID=279113 RepID=UPI003C795907